MKMSYNIDNVYQKVYKNMNLLQGVLIMKSFNIKRVLSLLMICSILFCSFSLFSCENEVVKYVVLDENFGAEDYSVGFRLGDNALTLKIQEILDEMIVDGTAGEISTKWFGSDVMLRGVEFPRAITEVEGDTSLQYILEKGELILGLDATFPPMGFLDEEGNIDGFDIDMAKEVCKRLGIELTLQPIAWTAKEMELNGKTIDCIWNGLSVDDERTEKLNLSKPYIANKQIIIAADNSGINTKADLAGKTVSAQAGSTALGAIKADVSTHESFAKLAEYDSNDDAYLDLKSGRVDAFVVDEVYGRYIIDQDK